MFLLCLQCNHWQAHYAVEALLMLECTTGTATVLPLCCLSSIPNKLLPSHKATAESAAMVTL
jgi:hypothetical protein